MIISVVLTCVLAEELYSDRFDHIDIQSLLQDDKTRDEYYNCFMKLEPCMTEAAQYFKGIPIYRILQKIDLYIEYCNKFL